jgi:hypothetical protein
VTKFDKIEIAKRLLTYYVDENNYCGNIDGADISNISYELYFIDSELLMDLTDDLLDISNILYCRFGQDYGRTRIWDDCIFKIIDEFPNYESNEINLNKVVSLILENSHNLIK